jgi:hypothetical protein
MVLVYYITESQAERISRLPAGLMVRYTRLDVVTHQPQSLKSVSLPKTILRRDTYIYG